MSSFYTRRPIYGGNAILSHVWSRFWGLLWAYDTEMLEGLCSVSSFCWGLALLVSAHTYDHNPGFVVVRHSAPRLVWALGMMASGTFKAIALLWDEFNERSWRRVSAFISTMTWTFLTAALMGPNAFAPGVYVYLLFALANGWLYFRLSRGVR